MGPGIPNFFYRIPHQEGALSGGVQNGMVGNITKTPKKIPFGRRKTGFLNPGKTVKSDKKVGYLESVFFDAEYDKIG